MPPSASCAPPAASGPAEPPPPPGSDRLPEPAPSPHSPQSGVPAHDERDHYNQRDTGDDPWQRTRDGLSVGPPEPTAVPQRWQKLAPGVSVDRQAAQRIPSNGAPHSVQKRPPVADAPHFAQRLAEAGVDGAGERAAEVVGGTGGASVIGTKVGSAEAGGMVRLPRGAGIAPRAG